VSDFERFCQRFLVKRSVKKRQLFEAVAEFWRFSEANLETLKNDQPERKWEFSDKLLVIVVFIPIFRFFPHVPITPLAWKL